MSDLRYQKTERAIRNAFFRLLGEKDLSQITVSEISKEAELGRGTFYLHYMDVYDLFSHIVDELIEEMGIFFDTAYPSSKPSNIVELTNNITKYIDQRHEFFRLLLKNKSTIGIISKLKDFFYKKILEENERFYNTSQRNQLYDETEALFVVSGYIGIIENWLNNNMTIPRDSISKMLQKILLKFSETQLSGGPESFKPTISS